MIDKNVSKHDRILTEQIHEDVVTLFYAAIAAMTMQEDTQGYKECYALLLPTIGRQQ